MANDVFVNPDDVRLAIDTRLSEAVLSDAKIESEIFSGVVIREVKARDPDWATRTDDDVQRLNNAAAFLTAALIIESMPNIIAKAVGEIQLRYEPIDPLERAAILRGRAETELAGVVGEGLTTDSMPTMFSLATGRRGL